jgi:hypothetical protein
MTFRIRRRYAAALASAALLAGALVTVAPGTAMASPQVTYCGVFAKGSAEPPEFPRAGGGTIFTKYAPGCYDFNIVGLWATGGEPQYLQGWYRRATGSYWYPGSRGDVLVPYGDPCCGVVLLSDVATGARLAAADAGFGFNAGTPSAWIWVNS